MAEFNTKAVIYNIEVEAGSTLQIPITWNTRAEDGTKTPVDLTGYGARMTMRRKVSSDPILELNTVNGGIIITDEAAGQMRINLTATQTSSIIPSQGVYDLELINGTNIRKLMKGVFEVDSEVTR